MGISRAYSVFASGAGRKRAAILIKNNDIDAVLINHQARTRWRWKLEWKGLRF